jgi:hypothetical protein
MKTIKRTIATVLVLGVFGGSGYLFWMWNDGVSHRDIRDTVVGESHDVQALVDERCGALDAKLDAMDKKLDSIESKLDAIIRLASEPQLPDGMVPVAR